MIRALLSSLRVQYVDVDRQTLKEAAEWTERETWSSHGPARVSYAEFWEKVEAKRDGQAQGSMRTQEQAEDSAQLARVGVAANR